MLDLPIKQAEIEVETLGGVTFRMATLTDEQVMELVAAEAGVKTEGERVLLHMAKDRIGAIFDANVRGAEGLSVAGEPFDARKAEHRRAVKSFMKAACVQALLRYEFTIPQELEKNSPAPAGRSPKGSTRSEA